MPSEAFSPSFPAKEFEGLLRTHVLGRCVHCYDTVASTNDVAFQLAFQGANEGDVVVAEEQSAGRGRLGREWFSGKGEGLYASLILRPSIPARLAPMLNLLAAVAAHRSLQTLCGLATDIKWPNDILIQRKKCCGILTEMNADAEQVNFLVVGIGVNVSHRHFPPGLVQRATSIYMECNQDFSRQSVLAAILNEFEILYLHFLKEGALEILDLWVKGCSGAWGKRVLVEVGDRTVRGITRGLSHNGALRIMRDSGNVEEIVSGDVVEWE